MNEQELNQFTILLKKLDPELYQLFEIVSMVKRHGYGTVKVEVVMNNITKIEQMLGFKLR